MRLWVLSGVFIDATAREVERVHQELLRVALVKVLFDMRRDHLDGERRGDLSGVVPTHAVTDEGRVVAALLVVEDGDGVFVVVSSETRVARTGDLDFEGLASDAFEDLVHG
jgi:hypothetical protein